MNLQFSKNNPSLRICQIIILCFSMALSVICYSQETTFAKYNIPSLGNISIPTNMELQSGKYQNYSQEYRKEIDSKMLQKIGFDLSLDGNDHIFQPKGLNDFDKQAMSTYARIIISTEIGEYGDYDKLDSSQILSSKELRGISSEFFQFYQEVLPITNNKIIRWDGIRPLKLNKYNALEVSYLRQLNDNPHVVVKMYLFNNNDRLHTITTSYRQNEEALWKPLLTKAVENIVIYKR